MKCLGISSAMSTMGASIVDDEKVMAEFSVSGADARSEKLVAIADEVLKKAGLSIDKVDAIAVTKGPGSYSGLRGGLAIAKSFAGTLNIPIIGVSTLEAIAYNHCDRNGTVAVVLHACRDEYNIALFASRGGSLTRLTDDLVVNHGRLIDLLSGIKGVITLAAEKNIHDDVMKKNKDSLISLANQKNIIPWAVNVAKLGMEKLMSGEKDDYLTMVPEYSHRPNIREFKS